MSKPKGGLGKGLAALIPASSSAPVTQSGLMELEVTNIVPNPRQPRMAMDPIALAELADSIREHGLIQPLIVTQLDSDSDVERYQLIAGERRLQAAKLAGYQKVPVVVKEATPQAMLELALVENIQRADLNALEEALSYRQLVEEFDLTQEDVAKRVGKSRVTVTNSMRLLRLPDSIKESLGRGDITEGHARALIPLNDELVQLTLLARIIKKGLNVRQVEEIVRNLVELEGGKPSRRKKDKDTETLAVEERFRRVLGTKVELVRSRKGGRVVIHYFSEEELQGIYEAITGKTE